MTVDQARQMIVAAIERGRAAHGYLIVGNVRKSAAALANGVMRHLYGERDLRAHPDIHSVRPEMKTRVIGVDAMKERIIDEVAKTAFEGGWKTGIVHNADRLRPEAANAFLKTLEEPPPSTLFFLLTENPERLLPTIISRCQRIDLEDSGEAGLDGECRGRIIALLASEHAGSLVGKQAIAAGLSAILEEFKTAAKNDVDEDLEENRSAAGEEIDERTYDALVTSQYREYRARLVLAVMQWCRDLMALCAAPPSRSSYDDSGPGTPLINESRRSTLETRAARISMADAFKNIRAVEDFATSLERNINDEAALSLLLDRLNLGAQS